MIRLFLDTEWADVIGSQLVSLALVSENGSHRFYCEIDPLPDHPSDFVRSVVYPLLERGNAAASEAEFTRRLREFFQRLDDDCVVHYDYGLDGGFLRFALDGFENMIQPELSDAGLVIDLHLLQAMHLPALDVPEGTRLLEIRTELLLNAQVMHFVERYFAQRPEMAARRHHAGIDAEALRRAYIAAIWGVPVESAG